MKPVMLKALKASIVKWENNAKATQKSCIDITAGSCPLCLVCGIDCRKCPVGQAGHMNCTGTPYYIAFSAWSKDDLETFRLAAEREVEFLKSLLPAHEKYPPNVRKIYESLSKSAKASFRQVMKEASVNADIHVYMKADCLRDLFVWNATKQGWLYWNTQYHAISYKFLNRKNLVAILRAAATLIREGEVKQACHAIQCSTPLEEEADFLIAYIKPFWNHNNRHVLLSDSLLHKLGRLGTYCSLRDTHPFFQVAREKMLLAAADALEQDTTF